MTPVELMYMYTGLSGASYWRYSSSASSSSVTEGTSDIPWEGKHKFRHDVKKL